MSVYVGTSGWMYDGWRGGWYGKTPKRLWLAFDAERFTGLEIDGTFYGSKPREIYERWAAAVPEGFKFAVRGHKYVSHNKKLKDVAESVGRCRESAMGLGNRLGPVLWQTPPMMRVNVERLRSFAEDLKAWPEARHVLEFRHESWFTEEVAAILGENRIANCLSDAGNFPMWPAVTTDLVYVRLHGNPLTYVSRYEDDALDGWAERVRGWGDREVHVYFDNDAHGHAPHDAMRLLERLRDPSR